MMVSPIRPVSDGLRWSWRPSLATPESHEITVMPRSIAFFSTGTSASASLAETAIALTFCAISELITSDLGFGGRLGRTGIDDIDIAQFLGRFLGALVGGVEEAVAERLH